MCVYMYIHMNKKAAKVVFPEVIVGEIVTKSPYYIGDDDRGRVRGGHDYALLLLLLILLLLLLFIIIVIIIIIIIIIYCSRARSTRAGRPRALCST